MFTPLALGTPVNLGDLNLKYNPLTGGVQTIKKVFPTTGGAGVRDFISALLPNILLIASLLLTFLIIAGGLGMIITAGNPEAQQKSKGVATNAAIGFLIIIGAYWLIQVFQVITGINILKP